MPIAVKSNGGCRTMLRDIFMLMKPRIIVLLAITCAAGYLVATKGNGALFSFPTFLVTLLGLSLSAGGANMINMWFDEDIDRVMDRTKNRPIPAGRMQRNTALYWGVGVGLAANTMLALCVNPLTAAMSTAGYLFYVLIYTMWLKRRTVQNIVIGGAAGAFPPIVGWAAVQNSVADPIPWLMFAVIFLWTPPHFWALALMVNKDYINAQVPMLPVVKGGAETKAQMLFYQLLLLPTTLAFALFAPFGLLTLTCAFALNLIWIFQTQFLMRTPGIDGAQASFTFSLYYLALFFLVLVGDTFI